MTSVSPYPHWHYFDAYPPGVLRAVYRGNGIPLPWGNMRMIQDPCQHWAVFRMLTNPIQNSSAQISILKNDNESRLYCCKSVKIKDAADNDHVICAGIDLVPALESRGANVNDIISSIEDKCIKNAGSAPLPVNTKKDLISIARILNIGWIEEGLDGNASIICPRSMACPRKPECVARPEGQRCSFIDGIRAEIISNTDNN